MTEQYPEARPLTAGAHLDRAIDRHALSGHGVLFAYVMHPAGFNSVRTEIEIAPEEIGPHAFRAEIWDRAGDSIIEFIDAWRNREIAEFMSDEEPPRE